MHEPGGVLTNFILLVIGTYVCLSLRHRSDVYARYWSRFVLLLSLASAGGLVTHGFPQVLSPNGFFLLWWAKNALIPLACTYALYGALALRPGFRQIGALPAIAALAKAAVVMALMAYFYSFNPVAADLGITYFVVIGLAWPYRAVHPGARLLVWAFAVAVAGSISFIIKYDPHPHWLTHKDVVHVVVYASLVLIYRSVRRTPPLQAVA